MTVADCVADVERLLAERPGAERVAALNRRVRALVERESTVRDWLRGWRLRRPRSLPAVRFSVNASG